MTGKITIDNDRNAVKPAVIIEMKNGVPTWCIDDSAESRAVEQLHTRWNLVYV